MASVALAINRQQKTEFDFEMITIKCSITVIANIGIAYGMIASKFDCVPNAKFIRLFSFVTIEQIVCIYHDDCVKLRWKKMEKKHDMSNKDDVSNKVAA